ncbi:TraR/DksA family transcriptional regulator [bacterium]|nr:TraR/DksA family transcriptional regulator [bacterium]MBU1752956.1 TraR/DksA family transcriptional regulator [bacterium]
MEKEKLALYREKLMELQESHLVEKKELEADYLHNSQKDESGDLSAYSLHPADMATDTYEKEKNIAILSNLSNTLITINEALYRIEQGSYGICEECRKEISDARLDAMPTACLCIECKTKKSNNKKNDR